MAGAYQGFVINKNLQEATLDRLILNNLGTSPIGDDITRFSNNNRNVSALTITNTNISGPIISFTNSNAVFSNRTPISVNNIKYYVKNSNGVNQFQLSLLENLSTTISSPPTGIYSRSDKIDIDNISNLSPDRRIADVTRSNETLVTGGSSFGSVSPQETLITFESSLDYYRFKKEKSIKKTESFLGNKLLKTESIVRIYDIDGQNISGLGSTTPGLFIYDQATNSGVRAFSSNANVWENVGGNLQTTSIEMNVGSLVFSYATGIVLLQKNAAIVSTVGLANVDSNFTHSVPVVVNGDTYSLCLKLEP